MWSFLLHSTTSTFNLSILEALDVVFFIENAWNINIIQVNVSNVVCNCPFQRSVRSIIKELNRTVWTLPVFCLQKRSSRFFFFFKWAHHDYVTVSSIHGTNFDILVQTPGRFASAHPIPQLIIPARKYLPSFPRTWSGPPESPCKMKKID